MITTTTIDGMAVTKSDRFLIRKVNPAVPGREEVYTEAWDAPGSGFTYEETDVPLPEDQGAPGEGGGDE